ncbi:MAG: hypothetical protein AAF725_15230, partial [Acidobacteriota bacterium]
MRSIGLGLGFLLLLLSSPWAVASEETLSVKSLAGPPGEFFDHALPTAEDVRIPTNILKIDRDYNRATAGSMTYTNFTPAPGEGFTLVQATTNYPNFAPATFTGPGGTRYYFNGSTLTCNSGPCSSSEAAVQFESSSSNSGGAVSISISGGEVTGGSWQLAENTFPGPLPTASASAAQVDSMIAFDENIVEISVDPDPCPDPQFICPFEELRNGRTQPFDLTAGAAPLLAVSAGGEVARRLDGTSPLILTSVQTTILNASTGRQFARMSPSLTEVANLPRNAAGDSLLRLPSLPAGNYSIRLDIEAELDGVGTIERTGYYYLPILEKSHRLSGEARAAAIDDMRIEVRLGVENLTGFDTHLYAYGEVWARDAKTPIAWIGGMTYPQQERGGLVLPLELDARWLALARETGGLYELRNVRIQDPDTFLPIDSREVIPFSVGTLPGAAYAPILRASREDDETMFVGQGDRTIPVRDPEQDPDLRLNFNTGILLVHGWCSGRAWRTGDFADGPRVTFEDFNNSRSHDNFAQRLRTQGDACFNNSFSVVAHSQGGAAATHLRAFYNSGLDRSRAPRRIQSMGTPFRGSTLMDLYIATGPLGWLIGTIFGGCSPQFSLSTVGSAVWRVTVPNWAKDDVFYYRTRHRRPGNFFQRLQFWRWKCSIGSYVIPGSDDGVTSVSQGVLSNGNNMGVRDGECHTDDMRYTDQRIDRGR